MLNKLRNSSKNSFVKIILGSLLTILILSFAMWGTEDLVGITNKQNTVASVGKIDISSREFVSLYSRQTEENENAFKTTRVAHIDTKTESKSWQLLRRTGRRR